MTEPLYKSLFDLEYVICKEFAALTPFTIDEMEYQSVIELFADLRDMQIRNEKKNPDRSRHNFPGRKEDDVIYRPAGDDWY